MPDWRIGAVIMKIIRSTRTTSRKNMLISESESASIWRVAAYIRFYSAAGWDDRENLVRAFRLARLLPMKKCPGAERDRGYLQKMIVKMTARDRRAQSSGGGHERSAMRSDGAKAGGASAAEAGKCVNDAPNGSKQTMNGDTAPVVASQDMPFSTGALLRRRRAAC